MGFSCGIIGLPNVGKSTIFNALTSGKAASENFPFCTIEPNTGVVPVPDPRVQVLADLASSAKLIPTQMTFVDIAGLIKGASKGEGLGNQFLGHIRSVDAVAHVVRCFEDEDIVHVHGGIDPINDVETIETELCLADLEAISKQKIKYEKLARSGDKEIKTRVELLSNLENHLSEAQLASRFDQSSYPEELSHEILSQLLTAKPILYVANVQEDDLAQEPDPSGQRAVDRLAAHAQSRQSGLVVISGKLEAEIAELSSDERQEYLSDLGMELSGLDRLTLAGHKLLSLMTFFTVGPKEAHAWTAVAGSLAPHCAGKIHSDFEKGFIRAEVVSYQDYVDCKGEQGAKEKGKLRVEGKEYVVQDGDIVHFRFNV